MRNVFGDVLRGFVQGKFSRGDKFSWVIFHRGRVRGISGGSFPGCMSGSPWEDIQES